MIAVFIDDNEIPCSALIGGIRIALNANTKSTASLDIAFCDTDALLKYRGLNCDIFHDGEKLFSGVVDEETVDFKDNIRHLKASSRYLQILRDHASQIGVFIPEMSNKSDGIDDELNFRIDGFCGDIYTDTNDNILKLDLTSLKKADIQNAKKIDCFDLDSNFQLAYKDNDTFKHCRLQVLTNRYWQRDCTISYNNGYESTTLNGFFQFLNNYHFVPAPPVSRVMDTYNGLSWRISGFSYKGLPKAGMYNGTIWNPNPTKCTQYRETGQVVGGVSVRECTQTSRFNGGAYYAMSATATATKRWTQEINTLYSINFNNTSRDDGFNVDNYSLDLRNKEQSDNWNAMQECTLTKPPLSLADGDRYLPLTADDEALIAAAVQYVANARAKKIYNANQILSGDIVFKNQDIVKDYKPLDLVSIDSKDLFIEWAIVDAVEYDINFGNISQSRLKIKGYYGGSSENGTILQLVSMNNGIYTPENRNGQIVARYGNRLNTVQNNKTPAMVATAFNEICQNAADNEFYGFSMTQDENGVVSGDGFSLKIPEIAKEKTDARNIDGEAIFDFEMIKNTITIKGVKC